MQYSNHNPIVGIPTQEQIDNFNKKIVIDPVSGCHIWNAAKQFHADYPDDISQAQGKFNFNGRTVTAYRFAMFLELGNQDPGPTVDHLCHNRICVNPLHLRCVPLIENNRSRRCVISEYCQKGHLRTPESVGIHSKTGNRFCRICTRITDKKRYEKRYAKEKELKTNSSKMRDFNSNPILNEKKVWNILFEYYSDQGSSRTLSRKYEISSTMIRHIVNGRSWKSVYDKFVKMYPSVV